MSKHSRTKLAPPKMLPESQALKTLEESDPPELKEESVLTELDLEIECPRRNDVIALGSSFLMHWHTAVRTVASSLKCV